MSTKWLKCYTIFTIINYVSKISLLSNVPSNSFNSFSNSFGMLGVLMERGWKHISCMGVRHMHLLHQPDLTPTSINSTKLEKGLQPILRSLGQFFSQKLIYLNYLIVKKLFKLQNILTKEKNPFSPNLWTNNA